jgi:hypothetical protein
MVMAEGIREGPLELNAAQMDNVTAGGFQISLPTVGVSAFADALGRLPMVGTTTRTLVRDSRTPVQFGFGSNFVVASSALATATGDSSRSTSTETSEDADEGRRVGKRINRTFRLGPTQITGFSSVTRTGLTAHNLANMFGGRFDALLFPN